MTRRRRLTFWEHIEELRRRVFLVLVFVLLFSALGYLAYPHLFKIVSAIIDEELFTTKITEGFVTRLRAGLLIGVFFSLPVLLIEITLFVFPALQRKEKITLMVLVISTFILFLGGVYFAYRQVLPVSMAFLKSRDFYPENVGRLMSYQAYLMFFFQFLIGFGLCFQFPSVLLLMTRIGFIKPVSLVRKFKYFIIVAVILSAVITPPDIVSQVMLTTPLIILYALCIPLAYLIAGRKS